jgi:periplasmic divalent cation tolerance protein
MTDKKIVLTTAGSLEEGRRIAQALVERRLAACVNIVPQIESIYRWQGKVESAREWLLIVKTTTDCYERVRAAISELHSYELPECICLSIEDGSSEYLAWIGESVEERLTPGAKARFELGARRRG